MNAPTAIGGPSALHECRVVMLSSMAALTGHVQPMSALLDRSRPDVLQLRPADCSLFVGDAKATETPGNDETYVRLSNYARELGSWTKCGGAGVLALVVAANDAYGWLRVLRSLAAMVTGAPSTEAYLDLLDPGTAVVWQRFAGATAHAGS